MEGIVLRLGMINDRILMEQYGIDNLEKDFFVDELRFIKSYRRKLYDTINLIYDTIDDYGIEKSNKISERVEDLTRSIVGFMHRANGYNLGRKIQFAKNIDMEISEIMNDISIRRGAGRVYRQLLEYVSDLDVFFQYAASETLMRDDKFVEIEEEQSKIVSNRLVQTIKKNFIDYIKENDLTKTDVLFLIGYVAQKRDETLEAYIKTPAHCEGCTRDDCMLPTVCEYNSDKKYVPSSKSKYDGVVQSLRSYLKGAELSDLEKDHIVSCFSDPRARDAAKRVVEKGFSGKRTFAPYLTDGSWAMVNEMNVKNTLRARLKNQELIDLGSVDENIIGLIINSMDFSKATAEQNSRDFIKNYFKVLDTMSKTTREDEKKKETFDAFLKTFEETLEEIKIEKGEE